MFIFNAKFFGSPCLLILTTCIFHNIVKDPLEDAPFLAAFFPEMQELNLLANKSRLKGVVNIRRFALLATWITAWGKLLKVLCSKGLLWSMIWRFMLSMWKYSKAFGRFPESDICLRQVHIPDLPPSQTSFRDPNAVRTPTFIPELAMFARTMLQSLPESLMCVFVHFSPMLFLSYPLRRT